MLTSLIHCISFPYDAAEIEALGLYTLHLPKDQEPHGFIPAHIIPKIPRTSLEQNTPSYPLFRVDEQARTITVNAGSDTWDIANDINHVFEAAVSTLISKKTFPSVSRHSEPFAILGAPKVEPPIQVQRFAASLFGIAGRGAHLTAHVLDATAPHGMRIWVPRRSAHLHTYPGKLDTTVAGGVAAGETPYENIIREGAEEASLPASLLHERVKSVGVLTYMAILPPSPANPTEAGLVCPDVIYCYDLELPSDIIPTPGDDEVETFQLMEVEEVKKAMLNEEFKDNCNLVMLDFFIRHGIVTEDNEPDFVEIVQRMHRRLPLRISPP